MPKPEIKGLKPTGRRKPRKSNVEDLVCHNCGNDVDYKTALRIPAVDVHPPGSRYLVCGIGCTKGLPVQQVGS